MVITRIINIITLKLLPLLIVLYTTINQAHKIMGIAANIYIYLYKYTTSKLLSPLRAQEEIATSILGSFSSFNIYRSQKKCFRYQNLNQKNFECRNKHN